MTGYCTVVNMGKRGRKERKVSYSRDLEFSLSPRTRKALHEAALGHEKKDGPMAREIVQEWLTKNGYLAKEGAAQ